MIRQLINRLLGRETSHIEFPDIIDVTITSEHYRKATEYSDPRGCPLYQFMRELYPNIACISVGPYEVYMYKQGFKKGPGIVYNIEERKWGSIYETDMNSSIIDDRCKEKGTYPDYSFKLFKKK